MGVAAAAGGLERGGVLERWGRVVGGVVSVGVILVLGVGNGWVFMVGWRRLKGAVRGAEGGVEEKEAVLGLGGGWKTRVFGRALGMVDRAWKMYPLGVLFGLGFDTSSEIALLGLASLEATRGTSIWLIMLFPALFAAGMALVDCLDGAVMNAVYLGARANRDALAAGYYSVVLTGITVLVAAVVGTLQVLGLVRDVWDLEGGFWDGVGRIGDVYEFVGLGIVGLFVVVGGGSVLGYPRWRRWVEEKRREHAAGDGEGLLWEGTESEGEGEGAGEEDGLMAGRRE